MQIKKYFIYLLWIALLSSVASYAADKTFFIKPVINLGVGYGFSEDDAVTKVTFESQPLMIINTKGAGAHGMIYQAAVGLDMKYQAYYAGTRFGYQKSNIIQSIIIKIPADASELKIDGGLYSSYLLTGRAGYFLNEKVILYLEGGYMWSTAGAESYDDGVKIADDTLKQHGPLLALGTMLNLTDHLLLDLNINYVDYCSTELPSAISSFERTSVESLNFAALLSVTYRF